MQTPGQRTVEAVAAYLSVPRQAIVKTLLYEADGRVVGVLVRGDRQVNEAKLATELQVGGVRYAARATIQSIPGFGGR